MLKLTDAEWAVMDALWADETAAGQTLGEVTDALRPATGWTHNTVHTYLTRMEGKGLVAIAREVDPHRYTAAVTREGRAFTAGFPRCSRTRPPPMSSKAVSQMGAVCFSFSIQFSQAERSVIICPPPKVLWYVSFTASRGSIWG